MRDSYERFLSEGYISKEQLFDFGSRETIYAPFEKAKHGWEDLKQRIKTNQPVYIRGFGRNGTGSAMFQEFYKSVLGNENVTIDPTNNYEPTKVIRDMTGYSKIKSAMYEPIRNYQISHIFGRTKNIFTFTAPWNIVYLPKIIDPFTGHEARGDLSDEYEAIFKQKSYSHFEPLIEDYNRLVSDSEFMQRVYSYLDDISHRDLYSKKNLDRLIKSVREELTPISIPEAS